MYIGINLLEPKPRIVQHEKKRYSLRLEDIYWSCLHDIAINEKKRVGALVAELSQSHTGINFSSYVRVFCLAEMQKKISVPKSNNNSSTTIEIFKLSPSPAVIINRDNLILDMNIAFQKWLGGYNTLFIHSKFTDFFTPLYARSFNDTIEMLIDKRLKNTQMPVSFTQPDGKVINSLITILDITADENNFFRALIWFNTQPALRIRVQ